ncbi:rhomboid protease [Malassezia sp. CBS 17886]|nr:rhomboid protease [Malassezia sp. CBS 17886]
MRAGSPLLPTSLLHPAHAQACAARKPGTPGVPSLPLAHPRAYISPSRRQGDRPTARTLRTKFRRPAQYESRAGRGETVIPVILGLNTLVFGAWWYARDRAERSGDPSMYWGMIRNFTSGEANLRDGRWWTLLTACFSQQTPGHFAFNMLTFAFTAPALLPIVGAARFVSLYLGAGLISSVASIAWPHVVTPHLSHSWHPAPRARFTQGASGSVYAIIATYAVIRPTAPLYVFYVLPIPVWICVSALLGWELYASANPKAKPGIDSVGHVGGLLTGILFGLAL